jgi:hypothetical protein
MISGTRQNHKRAVLEEVLQEREKWSAKPGWIVNIGCDVPPYPRKDGVCYEDTRVMVHFHCLLWPYNQARHNLVSHHLIWRAL